MSRSVVAERVPAGGDRQAPGRDDAPAAATPRVPLRVGPAHDPAEAQADRVADEVLRKLAGHDDGPAGGSSPAAGLAGIARIGAGGGVAPDEVADAIAHAQAFGRPLDAPVRRRLEPAFGRSLSGVRVHDDTRAAQVAATLSADAFTVGQDIFFGAGQYRPGAPAGDHVLAHELAHTFQSGPARRSIIHRKLRGTAEAVENLGGERTSGKVRKFFGKPTNWDKLLGGLQQYESTEAQVIAAPVQFGAIRPRMIKSLRGVVASISSWRKDNKHDENEASVAATHQTVADGADFVAGDYRSKAGRRQAIALLEPRVNTEMKLLTDDDPARWLGSLGLSPDKITNQGRQDAGQKNQVQELEYSTEAGNLTGFFKKDIGFNPTPEGHEVETGIRQYDPNYGARAVAMYRLDQLLKAGVTARAEFAVHQDGDGRSVLGTVLESAKGSSAGKTAFGMDKSHARRIGPGAVSLDDPVLLRGLNKLQILDAIAGQLDRHVGNYMIDADDTGAVRGVTGIDLDMAFGRTMTSPDHSSARGAHNYRGLPKAIDAEMGRAILSINEADIHAALTGLLSNAEVDATVRRFLTVQRAVQEAADTGRLRDDWGAAGAAEHIAANDLNFKSSRQTYLDDVAVGSYAELVAYTAAQIHEVLSGDVAGHQVDGTLVPGLKDLPPEVARALLTVCATGDYPPVKKIVEYLFDHHVPGDRMAAFIDSAITELLNKDRMDAAIVACQDPGDKRLSQIFIDQVADPFVANFGSVTRRFNAAARRQNRKARVGIGRGR